MNSNSITNPESAFESVWAPVLAILVALLAAWLSIFYATQPLLEFFGFRQTQTALTSYWMIKDGWRLAYETPVAGYPWSIPMEFPIYQTIVALIAYLFNFPVSPVGRLVSFCFLLACAWPVLAITRKLKLNRQVAWVFCALLWSSPIYLFWGRTFMIETTAVFFTLAAIVYAIDLFESSPRWSSTFLFAFFATLGMLQKVTTTAPIVLILVFILIFNHFRSFGLKFPSWRKISCLVIALLLPFTIVYLWTNYSDFIKTQNSLGSYLTSNSLTGWNFGTVKQRFDFKVLKTIFWDRIILNNAAGLLGIAVIIISLYLADSRILSIILISLVMFVLPILIFLNLHFIHNYYQVSSALFLTSALAAATVLVLPKRVVSLPFTPIITIVLVCCNLFSFSTGYAGMMRTTYNASQTEVLAIGDVIRRYTSLESGIVVFGADWSSEIGYYSERKSFTVPGRARRGHDWYKEFDLVWLHPASFLGDRKLGAIVFCISNSKITLTDIIERPDVKSDPCLFKIKESYIWLPGVKSVTLPDGHRTILPMDFYEKILDSIPAGYSQIESANFDGSIDRVNGIFPAPEKISTSNLLSVEGWLAYSAKDGIAPDDIFLTLKSSDGRIRFINIMRESRKDVNEFYKQPTMPDVGFKANVDVKNLNGEYSLGLAMGYNGRLFVCDRFKIPVIVGMK